MDPTAGSGGGNPNIIEPSPVQNKQTTISESAPGGDQATQSGPATQTQTWKPLDPSLAGKGWQSQADFEKSYLELERNRSQYVTKVKEQDEILAALDPYAEEIKELIARKQAEGKNSNNDPETKKLEALLRSRTDPLVQQVERMAEAQMTAIQRSAAREFRATHPDMDKAMESEMVSLIVDGGPIKVSDLNDYDAYIKAFDAAYHAVTGAKAKKVAAGTRAAQVAGSGGQNDSPGGNRELWEKYKNDPAGLERHIQSLG